MKVELFGMDIEVEVIEESKHIDEGTGMEAYYTEDDRIVAFDEAACAWVQLGIIG